jgi:hypothetical protein
MINECMQNLTYEMKPPCLNSKIHNPYIARNLSCFQLAKKIHNPYIARNLSCFQLAKNIHNPYIARNLSRFQLANKGEWSPKA